MRKAKSMLCILLTIMLSLSACVRLPNLTTGGVSTTAPIGSNESVNVDIDLTGKWIRPGIETGHFAFSDTGCYLYNSVLQFMDIENGVSVVLCTKPSCRHAEEENTEDCEAHIRGSLSIFFYWDEHIYYTEYVQDDPNGIHLFRRNADGTGEEKVATLAEEYCTPKNSVSITKYVVADGILYCLASLTEIVEVEPDNFTIMERDTMILKLDLRTRKQEELVRYENTFIRLLGARKDALLFYTQERLPAEENLAPDYYERMQKLPARLHIWTDSNKVVTLFEKPNKECSWVHGLMGNVLFYTDDTNQYAYDLTTNSHSVAQLPFPYMIVSDSYILDQSRTYEDMAQGIYSRFWDARTGNHIPSDFNDADISVISISDNGCILNIQYIRELEPSDGGYIVHASRKIQAYVSFAAMEDGLQKEDILIIEEKEY